MSVIIILIIVSVSVASIFLLAFFWSVKNGQFDDTDSPAVRILYNDSVTSKNIKEETESTQHKKSTKTQ